MSIVIGGQAISDKLLLTGANGFIGLHLSRELSRLGLLARAAVRNSQNSLPEHVEVLKGCTLESDENWASALTGVDCVLHCAARVHVMKETEPDPEQAFHRVNIEGTLRLARFAAEAGVRRFVFLSSVKVLGEGTMTKDPYTEETVPAPEEAYGRSKLAAEQGLIALSEESGMEVVIVRCPLVYGPGVGGNFHSLMKLVDSPWPLPFGHIDNARSLVFVGNLVDFLVHVIDAPKASGQTFLVSDGVDLSTTKLIELLRGAYGRPPRLFRFPWRWVMPIARLARREAALERLLGSLQLDIGKARDTLGWQPPFSVEQGIADTVKSCRLFR